MKKPTADQLIAVPVGTTRETLPMVERNRQGTRTDMLTSLLFAGAAVLAAIVIVKRILR